MSGEELENAELVVGELAGNSARHGRCELTLQLTLEPDGLHIIVTDFGIAPPQPPDGADHDCDEHGRGMHIVEALSQWVRSAHKGSSYRVHALLPSGR
ncbi:ATP-binding protein [Streptomyces sp. NA04227]|uniref:ATP-binding protein n=1 Tax=Streptomyces sp. NA04227 TaxID=2742136 RepID=UPI001591EC8E|nr:ATP-binding protein [Streptomyces sp. NA04227]QKW10091.1 ATP-binding protein [Streptomyces sp. NA04227]